MEDVISRRAWVVGLLSAAFVPGCGSGGSDYSLPVGSDDGGGGSFAEGDGGSMGPLDASIEENHVTIRIVTLSCAGDCANVEAVATGGHPPYTFAWDDGSTIPTRRVCPTSDRSYHVKVTDTGSTGELTRAPESVQVPLTAKVLACPDAGAAAPDCTNARDSFDVAASFVASGANPAGAWSYGYSATLGSAFVRYPDFVPATGMADGGALAWTGVVQWMDLSLGTYSGPVPDVVFNPSAVPQHPPSGIGSAWTLQPGQFGIWPGNPGADYSIARWTAPSAGAYVVRAVFVGIDGDNGLPKSTTDVHVQHNQTDVPTGSGFINLNGGGNSFSVMSTVGVAAGDTVDFAVGPGDGQHTYDAMALDARVCKAAGDGG